MWNKIKSVEMKPIQRKAKKKKQKVYLRIKNVYTGNQKTKQTLPLIR